MATDRFEVDRLGKLAFELDPVVPCRCILTGGIDDCREFVEAVVLEGWNECLWLRTGFAIRGFDGNVDDETVLE